MKVHLDIVADEVGVGHGRLAEEVHTGSRVVSALDRSVRAGHGSGWSLITRLTAIVLSF